MFSLIEKKFISQAVETARDAIFFEDPDGKILLWNHGAENLYGYSADQIIGEALPGLNTRAIRETLTESEEPDQPVLVSQERCDGSRVLVWVRSGTLRDEDGNLVAFQHCGRLTQDALGPSPNATLRGGAVQRNGAAEHRFEVAVEAAPCGMLMLDSDGRIALVNTHAEELFGYPRAELLGASIENLVPQRYRARHADYREEFGQAPTTRSMGAGRELFGLRKDGTEVPVEIGLNPITTEEGSFVLASVVDSTERRKRTKELRKSLRDKELLLQEIHHRVKNNLAVIGSILFLQSSITEDKELLRVLTECQNRIRSMSLVHERLYLTGDLGQLNFADYVRELAEQLARNNILSTQRISLEFQLESLPLDLKQAVPCGLILNELLSNAFKHAFTKTGRGSISVLLHRADDGKITLVVQDDGLGDESISFEREGSLGFRLIRSLTRQLDGEFEIQLAPGGGTRAQLSFMEMREPYE